MILFLDFDYTLLDTARFKQFLTEHDAFEESEKRRTLVQQTDMSIFLYPDAVDFLKRHGEADELILVTFGPVEYQKLKVEQSGIGKYFKSLEFTGDEPKDLFIKSSMEKLPAGERAYFLDDRTEPLEALAEIRPTLTSVRMCRETGAYSLVSGAEGCPRVANLAEFEALIAAEK